MWQLTVISAWLKTAWIRTVSFSDRMTGAIVIEECKKADVEEALLEEWKKAGAMEDQMLLARCVLPKLRRE